MENQNQQGEDMAFNFPEGTNPFLTQQNASEQPSEEGSIETSLEGQLVDYQQAQDEPEPTFNAEMDASNGINVNSPEYKYFQAAFTRARQNDKPQGRNVEAELDELRAMQTRQQIEREATEQPLPELPSYRVDWQNFRAPQLPPDSPLAGHEEAVLEVLKPTVEYVLSKVNEQGQQFAQQARAVQARDYITEVVEEIGVRGGPEAKTKALSMLREYRDIARSTPEKWARFVVGSLGLIGQNGDSHPAPPAGNPQRMAQQVRSQGTRPSAPSAAVPRIPKFEGKDATRKYVEYAFDQVMRQGGR